MNIKQNTRKRLRNRISQFRPLLEYETFVPQDIDWPDNVDERMTIHLLVQLNAIEKVETVHRESKLGKQQTRTKWTWRHNYREHLLNYLEDRNELPCGHRAHIRNSPKVDGLSCRECNKNGEYPEYSKELVEDLL